MEGMGFCLVVEGVLELVVEVLVVVAGEGILSGA